MKSRKKIVFWAILVLAIGLRFYQLGVNPPSLDWDEASLGYNAYHLLKTGTDEYGYKWPLAIRSFADYKPPLYSYLAILPIRFFGLNEFSVRFPSAFFGVLTVLVSYFLVKQLFGREDLALLSMFLITLSPWHLQFSRAAFEANLALFWFILGIWLFLKALKKGLFFSLSAISFSLSIYSYHSSRLVAPLLLAGFGWHYRHLLIKKKKAVLLAFLIGLLMSFPLAYSFKTGASQARFTSAGVFSLPGVLDRSVAKIQQDQAKGLSWGFLIHNRRLVYGLKVFEGYLDHWDLDFLFLKADIFGRHHAVGMGLLYLVGLPFLLAGIYWLLKKEKKKAFPLFWWFLVAPMASALADETPHAIRSLLFLPTFQIFTAYGFLGMIGLMAGRERQTKIFLTFVPFLFLINVFYYFHQYYVHTPIDYAPDWLYGYKQMVKAVSQRQGEYEKVVVTKKYDQPYIYFLFYQPDRFAPSVYQNDGDDYLGFDQYQFRSINWSQDKNLKRTLLVGTAEEIPPQTSQQLEEIYYPNGEVVFRIIGLKD